MHDDVQHHRNAESSIQQRGLVPRPLPSDWRPFPREHLWRPSTFVCDVAQIGMSIVPIGVSFAIQAIGALTSTAVLDLSRDNEMGPSQGQGALCISHFFYDHGLWLA
ncbi:hypothetical protein PVAP13_4KG231305 [Panicum virgatum]|uniref:Uncharacterized protein n=1 Tax=Panicum virgatum TaxID=38727 RepID=A0A8T0TPR8_PANVG|nr:hypothetical protein PVAP13_4KG231305 [Panicum virgatum]KAG2611719.1 hypothetical protein PVAP13_4KG231305 [Panicum virgatum]